MYFTYLAPQAAHPCLAAHSALGSPADQGPQTPCHPWVLDSLVLGLHSLLCLPWDLGDHHLCQNRDLHHLADLQVQIQHSCNLCNRINVKHAFSQQSIILSLYGLMPSLCHPYSTSDIHLSIYNSSRISPHIIHYHFQIFINRVPNSISAGTQTLSF